MSRDRATNGEPRAGGASEAYRIGYEAFGPVFTSFGRMVLERAGRLGLARLCFVARDGDLLRSVVGRLDSTDAAVRPLEHRYLLVSRRSSQLPAAADPDPEAFRRLGSEQPGDPSLAGVLGTLNLDRALLAQTLERHGLAAEGLPLAPALEDGRIGSLLADGEFHAIFRRERDRQKALLRRYLEQEGLFDGVPSALVDVGWRGTIQSNLEDAFGDDPAWGHPPGLYVGVWDDPVLPEAPRHLERKEGLVGDFRRGWRLRESGVHHAALLLEAISRAPHGTVLGYAADAGGRVEPVLAGEGEGRAAESAAERTLLSLREGIVAHAAGTASTSRVPVEEKSLRRTAQHALFRIAVFPTPDEIRILGAAAHTEGFDPAWSAALVSPAHVSPFRSPRLWAAGLRSPWRAGYVAATGGPVASGLYVAADAVLRKLPRGVVATLRRGTLRWTGTQRSSSGPADAGG